MKEINCQLERVRYKNPDNNYHILKVKLKNNATIIAKGFIEFANFGAELTLYGEWEVDKIYGRQFCFTKWEEKLPTSSENIEKYLANSSIKGIGPSYAKKIVAEFGENTFKILDLLVKDVNSKEHNQAILAFKKIKGLGKQRLNAIETSWKDQCKIKDIAIFLQQYDISSSFAAKVFNKYKENSIEVIKSNPYKLIEDIKGVGFKTADKLALKMGIEETSTKRLKSGILYCLNVIADKGHCYATQEQIVNMVIKELSLNIDDELQDLAFDTINIYMMLDSLVTNTTELTQNNDILLIKEKSEDGIKIYLPYLYYSELGISRHIKRILSTPSDKKVKNFKLNSHVKYDEVQKEAIIASTGSKFTIITGGPGTGKTTLIKGVIDLFDNNNISVVLAAPTGRAAKRLSEATGRTAKTIHRLLEYNPYGSFNKTETNKLNCDVLIVDESSMIGTVLMCALLRAVPSKAIIILVGDKDQLPSVDAGNVFRDIISSGAVKVIKLKTIYRQADANNSDIIKNAHLVNEGKMIDLNSNSLGNSDFIFINSSKCFNIAEYITELYTKELPNKYGINLYDDIQILSPMKTGSLGTIELNSKIQSKLHKNQLQLRKNGFVYALHDKVMQTKNDYNKNVFNGDIGEIVSIDLDNAIITINFDGEEIQYEDKDLENIVLAYDITIHKSQGSEFPIVILPITHEQHFMLERNLLYTAITRAKKLLILIGEPKEIEYCIANNSIINRNTSLKERLEKI